MPKKTEYLQFYFFKWSGLKTDQFIYNPNYTKKTIKKNLKKETENREMSLTSSGQPVEFKL